MVLEKTLENPLDCKEIQPVHPEGNHSWIFTGRTDVEAETPIFWPPVAKSWLIWKDPDWDRLKAGGGGEDREWDVWTASPTQWTRVWVDSGSWWWTGRPGVLWFMGSQRVGHDWATSLSLGWTGWISLQSKGRTLKSLLQHHSSKASVLWCSAFFTVQLSHPYMTTGKSIALTRWTFVDKVMSLLLNMLSNWS